ncbi:hypothetical protein F5Y13DRAFT_66147 [Hypoxylon sp. FL1857]|nr:hypothetical protein F5Y13DRAFT_66147 [Hypoxylon sp. FL1857]
MIRFPLVLVRATAVAIMASVLFTPFSQLITRMKVLGITRLFGPIQNIHGEDLSVIPDTPFTEDLHYHTPSGLLFGASEGDQKTRATWFPPLAIWKDPRLIGRGTIVVTDTKTMRATRLTLRDFDGPYNTHGIDIYSPRDDPTSVYIAAVNHLPNPEYYNSPNAPKNSKIPKARSRLELFHHEIGTSEATHIRSIWHPLIRTPNDVLFKSLNEIYVTNDHYYREGPMRPIEMFALGNLAPWTDLIHLRIDDPLSKVANDTGVTGEAAIKGLQSNNGLGHGRTPSEVMVVRALTGELVLAEVDKQNPPKLRVNETIQLDSTLDNPSYFSDPYAEKTGRDASGYVLAGMAQAIAFPNGLDPAMVWLVQPTTKGKQKWTRRLIFQDDGRIIRTASTAILVAVDPETNDGKKQAHLFVTGPLGQGIVVSKIDL